MSGTETTRLIEAYYQTAETPQMMMAGEFRSPPANYYNGKSVQIDIVRNGEKVAIAVQDITAGYRSNTVDLYTNKKFTPPVFKEEVPFDSFQALDRMPGENPFENPNYRANLIKYMMSGMRLVQNKIFRAMELQASQVWQTGTANLIDTDGSSIYQINYSPKASHFPTSANPWGTAGATIQADLLSLCNVIRSDGLSSPNQLWMGEDAYTAFINDDDIQKLLDNRRIVAGAINPMRNENNGAIYRGAVEIGSYRLDIFTYANRYEDIQTGVSTQYLDPAKVVVRDSTARMDATFGGVPNIGRELGLMPALLPELPGRFSNASLGVDMFTNVWITPDGESLFGNVAARPLYIPTAIDRFGCLDTGAS